MDIGKTIRKGDNEPGPIKVPFPFVTPMPERTPELIPMEPVREPVLVPLKKQAF